MAAVDDQDIGPALVGGPDFLVEVASPGDRSLDKLAFYEGIGVRELLMVDRDSKGALTTLDSISLHYGAHTLAVDPTSHRVYVAYASLLIPPRIAVFSPLSP